MIQDKTYDMIFMDHMMPGVNGVEAMKLIRSMKNENAQIPIVVLTANAVAGMREMYIKEGFTDYLSKPTRGIDVEQMLYRYLPKELIEEVSKEEQVKEEKTVWDTDETSQPYALEALNKLHKELPYVDIEKGLYYCAGKEELYVKILKSYVDDNRYEQLCSSFEKEDWKNYQMQVHSVKSTSLTVGLIKLHLQAKDMDTQLKAGNIAYAKQNHADLARVYHGMLHDLVDCGIATW